MGDKLTLVTSEDWADLLTALRNRNIGFCEINTDYDGWIIFCFPDDREFWAPLCDTKEEILYEFNTRLRFYTSETLARRMELFKPVVEKWVA